MTLNRFLVANYAEYSDTERAFYWRGYSFQVSRNITAKTLIGGAMTSGTFCTGIYKSGGTDGKVPDELLGHIEFTEYGQRHIVRDIIPGPVELVPGQWYVLAEGRKGGTGYFYSLDEATFDVSGMVDGEGWLSDWHPTTGRKRWNWQSVGDEYFIIGKTPVDDSNTNARPDIGFDYKMRKLQAWCKVGGQWKEVVDAWCKIGGNWKEITDVIPKIGGNWKD